MHRLLFRRHLIAISIAVAACCSSASADDHALHEFTTEAISDTYFSEGAGAGDINGDRIIDVVYGPYWFAGPDFQAKHEIYPPKPQDRNGYADHFFAWVDDFSGDGHQDVFVVGFPGTPAYVYENPGPQHTSSDGAGDKHWEKHQVIDWVSNESPQLVDMVGDERVELLCTRDGMFGFATIEWGPGIQTWEFHPVSPQMTATRFGHGLGAGDINGDGLSDILHPGGWFEQPAENALTSRWKHHPAKLTSSYGGAEMYAYDVDGDGDNDIITSEAAHDFGLSWYEQIRDGESIRFERHPIMGSHPSDNAFGVLFSELHSVALVDIDGDGLKDIVTGKTYWSHHRQSPMWDAGAVVYWFKLQRKQDAGQQVAVEWLPYQAAADPGIGRQITITDLNADGQSDIVLGGMKGAHVLTHQVRQVNESEWLAAQPKRYSGPTIPPIDNAKQTRGPKTKFDDATNSAGDVIEAETLAVEVTSGAARPQAMNGFQGDRWSGDTQLFWSGAKRGDTMTIRLPKTKHDAESDGKMELAAVMTCARDYGIVQFYFDGEKLGEPIDLFDANVVTSGLVTLGTVEIENDRPHTVTVQIVGANPKAAKAWMFGLDYIKLTPTKK
ncbi:FG-GAP repeat domain-containing protein [Rhodopirellula sp. MGV]|uniref:FG-GAP repeat domain-containing protein n=1 Tax=Rhodopirellula sp. MGV TaxID=2023130 RepID=UPI000B97457B|nr:VCBS repeat-containing protein [Rhodopirellula sp. MGV]OYP38846.1 cysteine protease [Rhodopirellula sp. MGV]PNY37654.1 VCBS repeat-containing protein [Rhodopirellula baltica]